MNRKQSLQKLIENLEIYVTVECGGHKVFGYLTDDSVASIIKVIDREGFKLTRKSVK